jgi:hypothetical protein
MAYEDQANFVFRRKRPYDQRRDAPETHQQHLGYLRQHSALSINREQGRTQSLQFGKYAGISDAQYKAVKKAFESRLPYLAPNAVIPPGTTVESLLSRKCLENNHARYGTLSLYVKDAAFFEILQRELASINEEIAVRQLYQLMHGHLSAHLMFSETGHSAAIPNFGGRTLIHVNTHYTVLDPRSFAVTPLCVVLGHEIEHANVPVAVSQSLRCHRDDGFTTAEEVRAIDGYENAMLRSLGRGERSTHRSYLVSLDPENHHAIAFIYMRKSKRCSIKPGESIQGKLIDADRQKVVIECEDGETAQIETRFLLMATSGLQRPHRISYAGSQPENTNEVESHSGLRGEFIGIAEGEFSGLMPEHIPFVKMEQGALAAPRVKYQIHLWQKGASRGDRLHISMDEYGRLHLRHLQRDVDPLQYAILQRVHVPVPKPMFQNVHVQRRANTIDTALLALTKIAHAMESRTK